jgi:hypothetical protein
MASSVRFSALIKRETMSATSTAAVDVPLPNTEPMNEIATCFVILNTVPHEMLYFARAFLHANGLIGAVA